jgi:GTP-binding protein
MDRSIVAIVGRPNVGKSTLFNRIVGKRIAIVEAEPGITRDRLYSESEWLNHEFVITDTGGIILNDKDPIASQVTAQAQLAMEEADVIVFVVDVTTGITPTDWEVAELLRRANKPVFVVVNKVDNQKLEREAAEFYALGLGDIYTASALSGREIADLLDAIVAAFPQGEKPEELPEDIIRLSIIGRPNVGKSSTLNAILGEERVIVSNIPGTTRDAIDIRVQHEDRELMLIDTAGIRRASKIQGSIEYYTVLRAIRAIERSDVALLLIDAEEGITDGDKRVGGYAHKAGKGVIIVVNKWDLRRKGENRMTIKEFTEEVRKEFAYLEYAPIVYTSALLGQGVKELLDTAVDVADNCALRIPTGELNRIIQNAVDKHPLSERGRDLKVRYATMAGVKPPTIILFVNRPESFHFSYRRYIENQIRKFYGYEGTPLRIIAKKAEKEKKD